MELEEIKNKLTKYQYDYFTELKEHIDLPIYFYGSISREDYVKNKSDLDVEVFTNNIKATKIKIEHLFNYYQIKNENRFIAFDFNNKPISGYKYFFKDEIRGLQFDFIIFNKSCEDILLHQHKIIETQLPFLCSVFLIVMKFLYYNLNIINKETMVYIKRQFWQLYAPYKSDYKIMDETEYIHYYNSQKEKEYLIKPKNIM